MAMYKIIFSHDVDITPKEATEMMEMSKRAGAAGGMEIGVEPCALITVGFIWPCGTLRIGGCGTVLSNTSANVTRLLGVSDAVSGLRLDPEKNMDVIQKMVVLGVKKCESKE
jgi:hypothetical protein